MCELHWDQEWPHETKLTFLTELALRHLREVSESDLRGREITTLLENRDFGGVCRYELRYGDSEDVFSLIHIRQALALFKKTTVPLPGVDVDREARAYQKFVESEELCRVTNECFRQWSNGRFQFHPFVERVLHTVSRKIDDVLGDVPPLSELRYTFGPGSTTTVEKRKAHPRMKLSAGLQCSPSLLPLVSDLLAEMPGLWRAADETQSAPEDKQDLPVEVNWGRLGFVPKTVWIDRGVVFEPGLNVMLQGGIGTYIRDRLRKVGGVDIRDQAKNQRLARKGSIDGSLATVDLSSASDTISIGLMQHLLSPLWFELLCEARSGRVEYKGRVITLEMFSSMGNGFTFPLQTLLFLSLAQATCEAEGIEGEVRAYGDDIIIPSAAAEKFVMVLRALGFIPNPEKSFWSGKFRESCGADYYSGIDIRPAYIDDVSWPHLFVLYNYYRGELQDDMAEWILNWIPEPLRLWGPKAYGDGHLHTERWVGKPIHRAKGYGGYTFDTYQFVTAKLQKVLPGDYLFPAYAVYAAHADEEDDTLLPGVVAPFLRMVGENYLAFGGKYATIFRYKADLHRPDPQRFSRKRGEWSWDSVVPGRGFDRASKRSYKVVSIYTLVPPAN